MQSRRRLLAGFGGLLATGALSACGTTEPANTTSTGSASTDASTGGTLSVTDSRGKQITLEQPATRVVTLEWGQTEDVIALGVQPVGVADIEGYTSWVTAAPITGTPVDMGTRGEPSLEAVASAEPDLIIGIETSVPDNVIEQMEQIAPVVLLQGADATNQIELMRENHLAVATLLGKQQEAEAILAELDASIEAARAALDGTQPKAVLTYINASGNTVELRMHSDRSLPMALANQVGVTNGFAEPGDELWGLGTFTLEQLAQLPADTTIMYWANKDTPDPTQGILAENAVWQALPAVQEDKVFAVADGIWIYGGPSSCKQWVEQLASVLA